MNNLNYKYISLDVIAGRILKHPLLKNMNYEDIIAHTVDVLRLVNVPRSYVESSCYKNIVQYKAALPDDCLNIKNVNLIVNDWPTPMIMATDLAHNHLDKLENNAWSGVYTYTVNGDLLHTNCEDGMVLIVYDTLMCDDAGIPMIPDNVPLIKAIEEYIKVQVFRVLVDLQKIAAYSLDRAEQEYSWYIGKAQTQFQGLQNDDDIESFLVDFKRLFITNSSHSQRHKFNSNREIRYKN